MKSIPGTSIRFGLDSALGLIPGGGDIGTAAASGWILLQARRSGMPKRRLARTAANIAIAGRVARPSGDGAIRIYLFLYASRRSRTRS
ncbi:DUF4112 domain-containing protein [Stieleria sp. ICT_E10.1]|uniref:DUF4112 domain-containing protein n=1 Tax=Stieleria sedimenti TaxID=2976331 RepID=UPI00217F3108|nr:DUF4112 domain-containing protein [Stieleria sedimenti]MCS7469368.1 DUF4112 domain-containing protein [Stieleria sedimenti]